jgi:hypothetical protein
MFIGNVDDSMHEILIYREKICLADNSLVADDIDRNIAVRVTRTNKKNMYRNGCIRFYLHFILCTNSVYHQ